MNRKIVTRSPHRQVGVINPAWLLNHDVEHESELERRFIMVALACPELADITHQPFQLELTYPDGSLTRYTPDFLIRLVNGDELIVEVKPQVFVKKHAEKLELARCQLRSEGKRFQVITDQHIDANGLSARAVLLMRYGRMYHDEEKVRECKRLLQEQINNSAKVRELLAFGVSESTIWGMVAAHQLRVPAGLNMSHLEEISLNDVIVENCVEGFLEWFGILNPVGEYEA